MVWTVRQNDLKAVCLALADMREEVVPGNGRFGCVGDMRFFERDDQCGRQIGIAENESAAVNLKFGYWKEVLPQVRFDQLLVGQAFLHVLKYFLFDQIVFDRKSSGQVEHFFELSVEFGAIEDVQLEAVEQKRNARVRLTEIGFANIFRFVRHPPAKDHPAVLNAQRVVGRDEDQVSKHDFAAEDRDRERSDMKVRMVLFLAAAVQVARNEHMVDQLGENETEHTRVVEARKDDPKNAEAKTAEQPVKIAV